MGLSLCDGWCLFDGNISVLVGGWSPDPGTVTRLRDYGLPLLLVLGLCVFSVTPVNAQDVDLQEMSEADRQESLEKIRSESARHREALMQTVGVTTPDALPPPADDPKRPDHISKDPDSGNWTDAEGRFYVRSPW